MSSLGRHLLYITILMCKHFVFPCPNMDNSTYGMSSIGKYTSTQNCSMHAFYDHNMSDCYILHSRKTLQFKTVTSTEMTLNKKSINLCRDGAQSTSNWNPNCMDIVLHVSHVPINRCSLQPGDVLNICLVFFRKNHEVYESFYCRVKLGWLHSKGIVFDEKLYLHHCPGGWNIPLYYKAKC